MSKKNITLLTIGGSLFVALAIIFFFFDLEISKVMVQNNPSFIFLLFAAVGEFPIYVGPILFGLVYGFTSENKNVKLVSHFVGLVATYIGFVRLINGIFETFYSENMGVIQFVLLSISSLCFYLFFLDD